MEKEHFIYILENLVMKRFKSIEQLKTYILDKVGEDYQLELYEKDLTGYDEFIDYMFVGSLQNEKIDFLCDFDIYFAKTRANEVIITEVGFEFE